MLAFLIVAFFAGISAGNEGEGLCLVDGNYIGVDNSTWPQPRNPNFGTFSATAYNNDTRIVTTTYNAQDTLKITIASNGTDKIAGIVGYFANPKQSPTREPRLFRVGNWLLDNENYTDTYACQFRYVCSHRPCKADGFTFFSDVNESSQPFDGVSQSELSLEWSFNYFDLGTISNLMTPHTYVFEFTYAYSGMLYWIIQADPQVRTPAEGLYPSPAQLKAGLKNDNHKAFKSGDIAFTAMAGELAYENFVVDGLEPNTMYTVYYYAEIINPPMLNFEAYVLTGEIGDNSTQQLYRTVAGDGANLLLVPETNPLPTPIQMMQFGTMPSAAYTTGPAMLLIALCLWLSSSQVFL